MKKILIIGTGSYVGESVGEYFKKYPDEYSVEMLDARNLKPEVSQFKGYDVAFHVAGIAHRKENHKNISLYYEVNRDLAIEIAKAVKAAKVRQLIIMSTMAVYGLTEGMIGKETKPRPTTHYGRSKLAADYAIWKMRTNGFKVAILRPPMIYGKGCKGNYQNMRKLSLVTPVFPKIDNQRSMLYIGNLCWFVKEIVDQERQGIFFPQNIEYVNTSEMVKAIAAIHDKEVQLIVGMNWIGKIKNKIIKKVFGSLIYENTDIVDKYSFEESIRFSEK